MALPSRQLFPDPGDETAVAKAWEAFLNGDEPSPGALRVPVDVSWQRCLQANVDPRRSGAPQPVSEQDLYLLRERQRELLEASAPVMACARDFLRETGTMMALADTHGTLLCTEGDPATIDSAAIIRLVPGSDWSERVCGTNAIGTALAMGEPVQIHSAEHFCAGIKRWTCSATVVRHPVDGEIVGVVDVSGLSSSYNRQTLALVVTTASRIESRLGMEDMERRFRLLDHAMGRWSACPRDALVLFDRRGRPIKANEHAQPAIVAAGGAIDLSAARRIPELAAGRLRGAIARGALPAWIRPEWLEPVSVNGEALGTLLVMPAAHGQRSVAAPPVTGEGAGALRDAGFENVLTADPAMRDVIARARHLARSRAPVLLQGETGAGKEEFARGIHGACTGPYVALNCGALSRELLASELFGYADGAFTGARKGGMTGKIEAASGGTLFLDEIAEMPLDMQPHLLRVLEQGEITRLGENTPRKTSFRLIAATHRDLRQEVAAGRFRMDLFYRVAVTSLRIPPLRERPVDIELLAQHFLARWLREQGLQPATLDAAVVTKLKAYPWPGNVRELRNVIEGALLTSDSATITCEDLAAVLPAPAAVEGAAPRAADTGVCSMAEGEEALIVNAIAASGGNLTLAARRLNIAKSTLYAKMQRYGLSREVARSRTSH